MGRLNELTDEQLSILLQTGDEAAFTTIYNRYWSKLLAMAYHYTKDKAAAEEVLQEVFMQLWDRREILDIQNIGAYLATAVKFSIFNQLLKNKRRKSLAAANYIQPSVQFDEELIEARFLDEYIKGVVSKLPEKCQLVFRYSREEALPVNEIASTLNISPKTVEAHLTKALKILRSSLRQFKTLLLILILIILYTFQV
ncbi:RNA polymerase sigma-70 factor [Chitinophaga silvatica]|uniref:RNA polymerase sigma-70 factor n=1 Tax=Chitinophaga silvatica TaxID=2282649 RepID=A0A3E1YF20_9BACT|nr:RNA polymerase sigma-70 factor [Chitinophaga silvatica]RFS25132.1 RNA polymerase sigma-70 factor [Chitinophaga silvatica]